MMNPNKVKLGALIALGENYGKVFSDNLLELWMHMLAPYSAEEVQNAVRRVMESYSYKTIPTFAELKKFLPQRGPAPAIADLEEAKKIKAEAEWVWLKDAISHFGYYNEPDIPHPTTKYVLRSMGGWEVACKWLENELHYRHDDFIKAWILDDGNVELMKEGAIAIEEQQKRIAIGSAQERQPRKIDGGMVKRLEQWRR